MQPLDSLGTQPAIQRPQCATAVAAHGDGDIMPTGHQRAVRVLILEDDPDIREILALVLSSDDGFAVEVVSDVARCLERLRASAENAAIPPFDVLLLDLVLRGGHLGLEVLREAATPGAQLRLPSVVVCTGLSERDLASYAPEIAASNARVVLKPFDIDELARALRVAALGALDGYSQTNEHTRASRALPSERASAER
ncbi:MAG: response regulator [Ktedonobacterales bacterium]